MIFGDLRGLKFPDISLTGEENPKNLTQETCPDRGSYPGPLCDRRACYRLLHSGYKKLLENYNIPMIAWNLYSLDSLLIMQALLYLPKSCISHVAELKENILLLY